MRRVTVQGSQPYYDPASRYELSEPAVAPVNSKL
jgi:hypothetical protein